MAALVLIPAYTPPLPADAHLTLVWPGDTPEPQVAAQLAGFVQMFSHQHPAFPVRVMGTAMFGTNHNEPVLLVSMATEIAMMRAAVQRYSKSEHVNFEPHVAIPMISRKLPMHLYFNQISYWPTTNGNGGEVTAWLRG